MSDWFRSANFGWFLVSTIVLFVVLIGLLAWAASKSQRPAQHEPVAGDVPSASPATAGVIYAEGSLSDETIKAFKAAFYAQRDDRSNLIRRIAARYCLLPWADIEECSVCVKDITRMFKAMDELGFHVAASDAEDAAALRTQLTEDGE